MTISPCCEPNMKWGFDKGNNLCLVKDTDIDSVITFAAIRHPTVETDSMSKLPLIISSPLKDKALLYNGWKEQNAGHGIWLDMVLGDCDPNPDEPDEDKVVHVFFDEDDCIRSAKHPF